LILPYPRPAPSLPDGVGPYQWLSTGVPAGHVAQRLGEELGERPDRVEHEPVVVPGLDDARLHLRPRRLGELRVAAAAPLEAGAVQHGVGAHHLDPAQRDTVLASEPAPGAARRRDRVAGAAAHRVTGAEPGGDRGAPDAGGGAAH